MSWWGEKDERQGEVRRRSACRKANLSPEHIIHTLLRRREMASLAPAADGPILTPDLDPHRLEVQMFQRLGSTTVTLPKTQARVMPTLETRVLLIGSDETRLSHADHTQVARLVVSPTAPPGDDNVLSVR